MIHHDKLRIKLAPKTPISLSSRKQPPTSKPTMTTPNTKSLKRKSRHSHHPIKKKKTSKSSNPNRIPLGNNEILADRSRKEAEPVQEKQTEKIGEVNRKEKKKKGKPTKKDRKGSVVGDGGTLLLSAAPADQQLGYFLKRFQSANGIKLSPLELEAFKGTCMVELSQGVDQDVSNFSKHLKVIFGTSWNQVLCDWRLSEGIEAGSPALIVISSSALRSLELLRGLKSFTAECRPVKLFAKHMKVEEQVSLLKTRVNIVFGTPSRIKKLIDMDALLLSRLAAIVLDMHQDAKGYSLLTLPQVSAEYWDLYKSHFHERLLEGDTRICFYGPVPSVDIKKATESDEQ